MKILVKRLCCFGLVMFIVAAFWLRYRSGTWSTLGWLLLYPAAGEKANGKDRWTKEQIEKALNESDLTTKERIRDWLTDMRGEEWNFYNTPVSWGKPESPDVEAYKNAERVGIDPAKVASYTCAWGMKGETALMSAKTLQIYFYFDKGGTLLIYSVDEKTLMP